MLHTVSLIAYAFLLYLVLLDGRVIVIDQILLRRLMIIVFVRLDGDEHGRSIQVALSDHL